MGFSICLRGILNGVGYMIQGGSEWVSKLLVLRSFGVSFCLRDILNGVGYTI